MEEPKSNLDRYISTTQQFILRCHALLHIKGAQKLEKKCQAELKFLYSLMKKPAEIQESHLISSNLTHYAAIIHAAETLPGVTRILRPFNHPDGYSIDVDVLAMDGLLWMKVIARKAQALHLIWAGQGQFGDRNIVDQAQEYVECAADHPVNYTTPHLCFALYNGVTESMKMALQECGVIVYGEVVPVDKDVSFKIESLKLLDDSDSEIDDYDDDDDDQDEDENNINDESTDETLQCTTDIFTDIHGDIQGAISKSNIETSVSMELSNITSISDSCTPVISSASSPPMICSNCDTGTPSSFTCTDNVVSVSQKVNIESASEIMSSLQDSSNSETVSSINADNSSSDALKHCSNLGNCKNTTVESSDDGLSTNHSVPSWSLRKVFTQAMENSGDTLSKFILNFSLMTDQFKDLSSQHALSLHGDHTPTCRTGSLMTSLDGSQNTAGNRLNLDITSLITLVSEVCHGGCNFKFREPILSEQAQEERTDPVLPKLNTMVKGKELFVCETALREFQEIMRLMGGSREKDRVSDLLDTITVLPDRVSERMEKLRIGGKIKERSKIIFGTGDHHQLITVTANSGFVRAAENQGVYLAVILHPSRALTELKERTAEPLPITHSRDSG